MIQQFPFKCLGFVALLLAILGSSCREPIVSQPPAQLHHVLKCKVNEVDWRSTTPVSVAYYLNNTLIIRGQDSLNRIIDLRMGFPAGLQTGEYLLSPNTAGAGFVATYVAPNGNDLYKTSNPTQGTGKIILDYVNTSTKVVSGQFYFKGINNLSGDSIAIRDGSFTIGYRTNYDPIYLNMSWGIKDTNWTNIIGQAISDNVLNRLYIIGKDTVKTVVLALPEYVVPGTYNFPFPSANMYAEYSPSLGTSIVADSGSISVTSHNVIFRKIAGTFSLRFIKPFTTDTTRIKNGTFDVTYQ